jgi:drug/metabolite transporter (DMT)-like permease
VLEDAGPLPPGAASTGARLGGVLLLSFLTVLWGTTFALTRGLETDPAAPLSPGALITLRFLLAALVCSPGLLLGRAEGPAAGSRWRLCRVGVELGFWLWCGYATQTIGLTTTTSGRSAFITSLNVVFVPAFVAPWGRRVGWRVWVAAAMALAGTAFLCNDNGQPNRGDGWTLLCAAAWAVYILRLERYAHQFPSVALTAVQLWTVAVLSAAWLALGPGSPLAQVAHLTKISFAEIAYLGVVTTALTTWLQTVGQRTVPGPQASLLYTMEPVWASLFAWLIAGEAFGPAGWAGAALILAAAVGSQWPVAEPAAKVVFQPAAEPVAQNLPEIAPAKNSNQGGNL